MIFPPQLKDPILSISHELEERRSELEQPQQRHEGESREGSQLLWLLRADLDRAHLERSAAHSPVCRTLKVAGGTPVPPHSSHLKRF